MTDESKQEQEAQRKSLFYTLAIMGVLLFLGEWYATQSVAAECHYNPVLGWNLHFGDTHIYPPWDYYLWCNDAKISKAIPNILQPYDIIYSLLMISFVFIFYVVRKNFTVATEHGSASFASAKDIIKSDLGLYESKNGGVFSYQKKKIKLFGLIPVTIKKKKIKTSGVVVGVNPFTHKLMLHDGVEHILLMAPTRSGKGVCTIVPTGLIWKHSIFFFDPKGELWGLTSGYRKTKLHQKVLKFEPLCSDGSAARWNPLAEVNYRTPEEISDVQSIVAVMVRPDGEQKGGDSFWPDSAAALLNGVILHLLYQHDKEGLPLPSPSDIMSFLSSPDKDTDTLFTDMKEYPHITPEEFLEVPLKDADGNVILDENGLPRRKKNPLKEIYGEYIQDFRPFAEEFHVPVKSIDEIRVIIQHKLDEGEDIEWRAQVDGMPSGSPYHLLLTHPKVAETAANMLNGAEQTRASIMQTAQTSLAIYQNPVVQSNMAVSDFIIRDMLDPRQQVSAYFVMQVKDIQIVKPIARLFIQLICSKLIRDMKFGKEAEGKKKQRLLLMLDEFPQLGQMQCIELALAICAGYGIKMCIVCQDVNQLNKAYTKDNSIGSNCHLHIYFTPNVGGDSAKTISDTLGKKTIHTVSHSDGGGLFKGSNSTSSTGRELMTPDEVSHMSSEKELVFVAGHKVIYGDKLRYYLYPWLLNRTKIQHPAISDKVTQIRNYQELRDVQAADLKSKEQDRLMVLTAKAEEDGLTLAEYLKQQEQEKQQREKEIIETVYKALGKKPPQNRQGSPAAPNGARHPRPQAQAVIPLHGTQQETSRFNQLFGASSQPAASGGGLNLQKPAGERPSRPMRHKPAGTAARPMPLSHPPEEEPLDEPMEPPDEMVSEPAEEPEEPMDAPLDEPPEAPPTAAGTDRDMYSMLDHLNSKQDSQAS